MSGEDEMKKFIADFHIHSCFSRATSKKLTPLNLAAWAQVKGLDVIGTGDFTHPGWINMLKEHLEQREDGLLYLKEDLDLAKEIPGFDGQLKSSTRFILTAEISSIYKRAGKVRKVHNLVFVPNLECALELNKKLAQVGNLESDGRPILGLDSRDLLEMVLELDPLAFVVPAHIWTPWFSLFGSRSGFDSLEECFGDLSSHIFALETGLSSDPEMNWLWSKLDSYTLISNSDAHSGENLAREANIFEGEISYPGIFYALRREGLGHRFLGTLEFFPEEGKYHLDGHRKCGVVMDPRETLARGGICPKCGQPLTVGVLNRILALADRENPVQPAGQPGFTSIIPLPEIIAEFMGLGPKTKKVRSFYYKLIHKFGSELNILLKIPEEELKRVSQPLALGISRMRNNEVLREPGFDGQYGKISVFSARERQEFKGGRLLVNLTLPEKEKKQEENIACSVQEEKNEEIGELVYNLEQKQAINAGSGPVLVLAGPGTGKTQTLMGRVNRLLSEGVSPRHILILTFTRKAAKELQERLVSLRGKNDALPRAETLHALAFEYWQQVHRSEPLILDENEARKVFAQANPELKGAELKKAWQEYNLAREKREADCASGQAYMRLKQDLNLVDYADLLEFWLEELEGGTYARPFTQILVDEIQDLSPLQLSIIIKLAGPAGEGFFGIGDPKQSIYGFRGAVDDVKERLKKVWPGLQLISLRQNYRSAQDILDFSSALFPDVEGLKACQNTRGQIFVFHAPTAVQEANWIGDRIKNLIGGTAHWEQDMRQTQQGLSPGDIAILVRFKALISSLTASLKRLGIPYCVPEQEVFYKEPRVELILRAVSRVLGITDEKDVFDCPEKVLAQGPKGIAAYLKDLPPFDPIFWQSRSFRELEKAYQEHNGWAGVLNYIRLESELDAVRLRAQKVKVMTMHAAKGLEFEAVFLPCLEDGIMPFIGLNLLLGDMSGFEEKTDEQEERRLLYVACTRARRFLFLSLAKSRQVFGKTLRLKSSRFLNEFPEEMVTRTIAKAHKQKREKRRNLF